MKLQRPIVFLDLETTGVDTTKSKIVEFAAIKCSIDGEISHLMFRINPLIPISPEATAVHGISYDDIKECPSFKDVAQDILSFIDGCDIGSYNGNTFDLPILYAEFDRIKIDWNFRKHNLIDVFSIYRRKESRDLSAAYMFYCNKVLRNAHSALADVEATMEIFFAQLEKYDDLHRDTEWLARYCNYDKPMLDMGGFFKHDEKGEVVFAKGKNANKKALDKAHKDYLEWVMNNDTMYVDTRAVAKDLHSKISKL